MASNQALPQHREEKAQPDLFIDLSADELVEAKEAVLATMLTEGWMVIQNAIERQKAALVRDLIDRPTAREGTSDYEGILGEIRGLERVESAVDGLILAGQEADSDG